MFEHMKMKEYEMESMINELNDLRYELIHGSEEIDYLKLDRLSEQVEREAKKYNTLVSELPVEVSSRLHIASYDQKRGKWHMKKYKEGGENR